MPRDTFEPESSFIAGDKVVIDGKIQTVETAGASSATELDKLPKLKPEPSAAEIISMMAALAATTPLVEQVLQNPLVPAVLQEAFIEPLPVIEWRIGNTHIKNPA